ncbi:hypothetical protein [uncultured Tateyamaria sp.]|uniref:hypothetical protein n=1 Tax=uncultured Tateyamaria sp. TaxID=455651 RepID=UPI002620D96A|nr:hypothetical protein [uncultured Tateyamaria sp.]
MMKQKIKLALAFVAASPTLAFADMLAAQSHFELPVIGIDANSFEVIEEQGAGGPQMWCAAAIYARKVLGQRGADLYIEVPRGQAQTIAGRQGVVFTIAPVSNPVQSYSFGTDQAGSKHSVASANSICRDVRSFSIRTSANQRIHW